MKIEIALIIAGFGQILTALLYPLIRRHALHWYEDLNHLTPLNREIAKTYGHYIQGLNFSFGLVTLLCLHELREGTALALALTMIIAVYWIGRVVVQMIGYPMEQIPQGFVFKAGTWCMNGLIVYLAVLYGFLVVINLQAFS
ncbi:MAG: hypothetical protein AAF546_03070 [Verrucomicrobiota bacterium]